MQKQNKARHRAPHHGEGEETCERQDGRIRILIQRALTNYELSDNKK